MILFKQYSVTASAVDLATAFGFVPATDIFISSIAQLIITQDPAAANPSFIGGPLVTAAPANAGFTFPVVAANIPPPIFSVGVGGVEIIDLRAIYIIGTVAGTNRIFATILF